MRNPLQRSLRVGAQHALLGILALLLGMLVRGRGADLAGLRSIDLGVGLLFRFRGLAASVGGGHDCLFREIIWVRLL